ncbi:hypothetical protein Bpfe_014104 [Biomphalaria pfeifferi]|uniref:Uncharacterized protein n=1 Tax=Biomphalaria pfeifferi TaxID=112525 RepID=A0AAD8BKI6_BIOPF|nr:hypothetical protein Bpfe_014104 [Biomphalaria pfeifferi]
MQTMTNVPAITANVRYATDEIYATDDMYASSMQKNDRCATDDSYAKYDINNKYKSYAPNDKNAACGMYAIKDMYATPLTFFYPCRYY